MDDAVACTAAVAAPPGWERVRELVDLVEIFESGVQLSAWPREFDPVGLRMVCTYLGPGTEWLDDQGVERGDLGRRKEADTTILTIRASAGEVLLLKGASWPDNERFGAVHRSPRVAADAGLRTLVTLDPIWR